MDDRPTSCAVSLRALLIVLALPSLGCPKPSAPSEAGAPSAPALPSASGSTASEAPLSARTCSLERGFRGTIGPKLEVLARLEGAGAAVRGHYLYTRIGIDLPLVGTLSEGGALSLAEGDPSSPSGRFTGTCETDGHLRGSWSKPGDAQPLAFDLEPIAPRDEMIVATRRKVRRFPPRPAPQPKDAGGFVGFSFEPKEACVDEVTWPEVFGARSAQDEASINRALTNDPWVLSEKASDAQLRACVIGDRVTASRAFEVVLNRSGIFAVREREIVRWEGGTHPWDPGAESWLAFDTRTGASLTKKDLLPTSKPAAAALTRLLDRCLVAYVRDVVGGDAAALADMRERVSLDNLALLVLPTEHGLHFGATGYAPPARVLEGEGPTISWAALVGAAALPATSPAARLWTGVAAAADSPCVRPSK